MGEPLGLVHLLRGQMRGNRIAHFDNRVAIVVGCVGCGDDEPHFGLEIVVGETLTRVIQDSETGLSVSVPLIRRFAIPTGGFGVVLFEPAAAGFIVFSEGKLRFRIAGCGTFAEGRSAGRRLDCEQEYECQTQHDYDNISCQRRMS
jgi:hypothetical protein